MPACLWQTPSIRHWRIAMETAASMPQTPGVKFIGFFNREVEEVEKVFLPSYLIFFPFTAVHSYLTLSSLMPLSCIYLLPNWFSCYTCPMFTTYLFHESAFKHGCTEEDIRRAFALPRFDGLMEGYFNKFLLTGFDTRGNLLEVMYNFIEEETVWIFHAEPCRPEYRVLQNQF
jgi:hypothetical protein